MHKAYNRERDDTMRKRKKIAQQCDCCDGLIYYGDVCDVFVHSIVQLEGSIGEFQSEKLDNGEVVKHLCSGCSELFTDVDVIRQELARALNIDFNSEYSHFKRECHQCGTELRRGHSCLTLDMMSVQVGYGSFYKPSYHPNKAQSTSPRKIRRCIL